MNAVLPRPYFTYPEPLRLPANPACLWSLVRPTMSRPGYTALLSRALPQLENEDPSAGMQPVAFKWASSQIEKSQCRS